MPELDAVVHIWAEDPRMFYLLRRALALGPSGVTGLPRKKIQASVACAVQLLQTLSNRPGIGKSNFKAILPARAGNA